MACDNTFIWEIYTSNLVIVIITAMRTSNLNTVSGKYDYGVSALVTGQKKMPYFSKIRRCAVLFRMRNRGSGRDYDWLGRSCYVLAVTPASLRKMASVRTILMACSCLSLLPDRYTYVRKFKGNGVFKSMHSVRCLQNCE